MHRSDDVVLPPGLGDVCLCRGTPCRRWEAGVNRNRVKERGGKKVMKLGHPGVGVGGGDLNYRHPSSNLLPLPSSGSQNLQDLTG